MRNKRKTQKNSTMWWQQKLDPLFRKAVRSRGYCQRCYTKYKELQCAHIKTTGAFPNLKYDFNNVLCLCNDCHVWWHANTKLAMEWFENKFPEQYAYILENQNKPKNMDSDYCKSLYLKLSKQNSPNQR